MQTINEKPIEDQFDQYIGKTWMHRGRAMKIKGLKIHNGIATVFTDGQSIVRPLEKLESFTGELLPMDDDNPTDALTLFARGGEKVNGLENLLMDNIEKIKEDKSYLAQAKAITNTVNTILNIERTKIKMVQELRKNHS